MCTEIPDLRMIVKCQLIIVVTIIHITFGLLIKVYINNLWTYYESHGLFFKPHVGQLQCLTSTYLSCSGGLVKGRDDTIETRLLLSMRFTCLGVIVGWTVARRRGGGTQYPKLQVVAVALSSFSLHSIQTNKIILSFEGSCLHQCTLLRKIEFRSE